LGHLGGPPRKPLGIVQEACMRPPWGPPSRAPPRRTPGGLQPQYAQKASRRPQQPTTRSLKASRRPKKAQGLLERPRMLPDAPEDPRKGPRKPQEIPEGSRRPPRGPRRPREVPSRAPRKHPDALNRPQKAPGPPKRRLFRRIYLRNQIKSHEL
jgi:hypothetical protein